jgi:hypothetical protein
MRRGRGGVFMEISAIMNIYELAMNRTVRQRADAQVKKDQTSRQDYARQTQQAQMEEKGSVDRYLGSVKPTITQDSYPVRLSNTAQSERHGAKAASAQQAGGTDEVWAETALTGSIVNVVS